MLVLPELLVRRENVDKLVVMVTKVNLGLEVTKDPVVLVDQRALVVSPVHRDFLVHLD